jgi:hypothetical protein
VDAEPVGTGQRYRRLRPEQGPYHLGTLDAEDLQPPDPRRSFGNRKGDVAPCRSTRLGAANCGRAWSSRSCRSRMSRATRPPSPTPGWGKGGLRSARGRKHSRPAPVAGWHASPGPRPALSSGAAGACTPGRPGRPRPPAPPPRPGR